MTNSRESHRLLGRLQRVRGDGSAANEATPSQRVGRDIPVAVATRRDLVGRILVPIRINDKGPFYLVANAGANTVALSAQVARRLNLPLHDERPLIVHGVTGSTTVPVARVSSITLGDLPIPGTKLPILGDAIEGADGMLGLVGLGSGQVQLDFSRHTLTLSNDVVPSHPEPASVSVPLDASHSPLLVIDSRIQGIVVKTILDTGAQTTIGNRALQIVLGGHDARSGESTPIIGVTAQRQTGTLQPLPPVGIGFLRILGARICYGDVPLFERVGLADTPAMLVGMDVLAQMRTLTLNYGNGTVQFSSRAESSQPHRRRR